MNAVFADAGYWIALRSRADAHHPRAIDVSKRVIHNRWRIITSAFVFAETYAFFSRKRIFREQVLRDVWQNPIVQVEQANYQDQQEALALLQHHGDKSFSFSDAVSFILMKRLKIERVISFDDHFRQYGHFEIIDSL